MRFEGLFKKGTAKFAILAFLLVLTPFFFMRSYAVGEGEAQYQCGMPANLLGKSPPAYSEMSPPFVPIRIVSVHDGCVVGNLKTLAIGFTFASLAFVLLYPFTSLIRRRLLLGFALAAFFGFLVPFFQVVIGWSDWSNPSDPRITGLNTTMALDAVFRGLANTGTILALVLMAVGIGTYFRGGVTKSTAQRSHQ